MLREPRLLARTVFSSLKATNRPEPLHCVLHFSPDISRLADILTHNTTHTPHFISMPQSNNSQSTSTTSLKVIGVDALRHILSFTPAGSLGSLAQCSKDLYILCNEVELWTQLHHRVYHKAPAYPHYPKFSFYNETGRIAFPELFVTRSVSTHHGLLNCSMLRKKNYFVLRMEPETSRKFKLVWKRSRRMDLLYARKMRGKYFISYNHPNDSTRFMDGICATVEADNLTKTRFVVRDSRRNGAILAQISFALNVLGHKGPRMFTLNIPEIDSFDGACKLSKKPLTFENAAPQYDRELKSHVLDLHGRATISSVMNFKIQRGDETVWLCGKKENSYSVDFASPFTAVSAFGLALASHASKGNRLLVSLRS